MAFGWLKPHLKPYKLEKSIDVVSKAFTPGTADPNTGALTPEFQRLRERVDVLLGDRGDYKRSMSALRRGEFYPFASNAMKSAQVAAAPTMDEHNALQADVKAIFDTLILLSNKMGNAKLPQS